MQPQHFTAIAEPTKSGGIFVAVPFDPDKVWGVKARHHVTGTLNGMGIRAVIESGGFAMGPAWLRDCAGVVAGKEVRVEIVPEGPQRAELPADIALALEENPQAGEFFDALAQFYRKAYLKWIAGTTRRPDERARRIAEMVSLLEAGVKQRPKP